MVVPCSYICISDSPESLAHFKCFVSKWVSLTSAIAGTILKRNHGVPIARQRLLETRSILYAYAC